MEECLKSDKYIVILFSLIFLWWHQVYGFMRRNIIILNTLCPPFSQYVWLFYLTLVLSCPKFCTRYTFFFVSNRCISNQYSALSNFSTASFNIKIQATRFLFFYEGMHIGWSPLGPRHIGNFSIKKSKQMTKTQQTYFMHNP